MTRPTHRLAAAATALAIPAATREQRVLQTIVAVVFAMAPDQAEMHRDRQNPDSGWCEHRGITHALITAILVAYVAYLLGQDYRVAIATGVAAGMGSHGGTDGMTLSGSMLLWPLIRRPVFLLPEGWRFRTGGLPEKLFLRPVLVGVIVVLAA